MSQVILLNGSSSSGKTTLALKLQQILAEPFQHISLDQFLDGMPIRCRGLNSPAGTPGQAGINVVPRLLNGATVTDVIFGPHGEQVFAAMRRSVLAFSAAGLNVVVDDLLLKPAWLQDYVALLDPQQTWFIGVHCSEQVVNRREQQRPGRFPGTAVAHFGQVHSHGGDYDLQVDTATQSPAQAAQLVKARLGQPPQAFARLRQAAQG